MKKYGKTTLCTAILSLIALCGGLFLPINSSPAKAKTLTFSWESDYGTLNVGKSKVIEQPTESYYQNCTYEWSTEDTELVSLSNTDSRTVTVTGLKAGTATIRCRSLYYDSKYEHNSDATGIYTVTVVEDSSSSSSGAGGSNNSSGSSSYTNAKDMGTRTVNVGQTITLTNPFSSSSMTFHSYNWESSNSSIASASTGRNNRSSTITAKKPGTVTIYGFLMGSTAMKVPQKRYNSITKQWEWYSYTKYITEEHNYKWTVRVNGNTAANTTNVSRSSSTARRSPKLTVKKSVRLKKGKTLTLKVKRKGSGKISYRSKNKKIATVSSKGKIKAKKKGKTTITVTVKAKGKYKGATKKVSVTVR